MLVVVAYVLLVSLLRVPDGHYVSGTMGTPSASGGDRVGLGESIEVEVTRSVWSYLKVRGINIWVLHLSFFAGVVLTNLFWVLCHNKTDRSVREVKNH